MKKLIAIALTAVALLAAAMILSLQGCSKIDVKTETDAEIDQAQVQFEQFHEQHPQLIQIFVRDEVGLPWTARLYEIRNGNLVEWEESGYPRLMLAIKAVEMDYNYAYNGHIGKYGEIGVFGHRLLIFFGGFLGLIILIILFAFIVEIAI